MAEEKQAEARGRGALTGLLSAEGISLTGSRMTLFALPWLVLVATGRPVLMGVVAAAESLPYVTAAAVGAPLVDRLGARRVSITADALSAVPVGLIPFVYRTGIGVIVVLVLLAGTLRGFSDISKRVLLPITVDAAGMSMARATALYDGISRLSSLAGGAMAGVLIAWLGAPPVVLVDACSFAVCALLVATTVRPAAPPVHGGAPPSGAPREPYRVALRAGVGYLRQDRLVLAIVTMMFAINLFDNAALTVYIPYWSRYIIGSPVALGICTGAFGFGAVAGNVAFTAFVGRLPRYLTFTAGFLIAGAPRFVALALSGSILPVAVVMFVAGLGIAAVNPIVAAVVYKRVPADLHARAFGIATAIAFAGVPLGSLLGGVSVQGIGYRAALLTAAAIYLLVTLGPVAGRKTWRQMNAKAGDAEPPGEGRRRSRRRPHQPQRSER